MRGKPLIVHLLQASAGVDTKVFSLEKLEVIVCVGVGKAKGIKESEDNQMMLDIKSEQK